MSKYRGLIKRATIGLLLLMSLSGLPGFCETQTARRLMDTAQAAKSAGDLTRAMSILEEASTAPGTPYEKILAQAMRADLLLATGKAMEAQQIYEELLSKCPPGKEAAVLHVALKQAYLATGAHEKAAELERSFVNNYPAIPVADFGRAINERTSGSTTQKLSGDVERPAPSSVSGQVKLERREAEQVWDEALRYRGATESSLVIKHYDISVGVLHGSANGSLQARGLDLGLSEGAGPEATNGCVTRLAVAVSAENQIRASFTNGSQNRTLDRPVFYDRFAYFPGTDVKLDATVWDVGGLHVVESSTDSYWGVIGGIKMGQFDMTISQAPTFGNQQGTWNQHCRVPYLGLTGSRRLGPYVRGEGLFSTGVLGGNGSRAGMDEMEFFLVFGGEGREKRTTAEWSGAVGYRYFALRADTDNDSLRLRLAGPIASIQIQY